MFWSVFKITFPKNNIKSGKDMLHYLTVLSNVNPDVTCFMFHSMLSLFPFHLE